MLLPAWLAVADGILCCGSSLPGLSCRLPPGIARDNPFAVEPNTQENPSVAVRPRDFSGSPVGVKRLPVGERHLVGGLEWGLRLRRVNHRDQRLRGTCLELASEAPQPRLDQLGPEIKFINELVTVNDGLVRWVVEDKMMEHPSNVFRSVKVRVIFEQLAALQQAASIGLPCEEHL